MKSSLGFRFACVLVTLLGCALAFSQPPSLKEKLTEKVVCDPNTCTEVRVGSFTSAFLENGIDPNVVSNLFPSTVFTISIGDCTFSDSLGSDPKFEQGDTACTLRKVVTLPGGKSKTALTVKLSWKNNNLSIRMKGITPLVDSPVANSRVGLKIVSFEENASLSFSVANAPIFTRSWTREYPSIRTVKTKVVNGTPYDLDTITVTGPTPAQN